MKSALIITDMQYDMCDGGPCANINSLEIIPKINMIRNKNMYDLIIFIRKAHPVTHKIFKKNGGTQPCHCIVTTPGYNIHNDINYKTTDIIVNRCSQNTFSSNSGFFDDDSNEVETRLGYILKINNIKNLYFCGNNMETCIFSTILDALNYGYKCFIIIDAIGYINKNKFNECINFLGTLGVQNIRFPNDKN